MAQVVLTKDTIRTKDYTVPKMRCGAVFFLSPRS